MLATKQTCTWLFEPGSPLGPDLDLSVYDRTTERIGLIQLINGQG